MDFSLKGLRQMQVQALCWSLYHTALNLENLQERSCWIKKPHIVVRDWHMLTSGPIVHTISYQFLVNTLVQIGFTEYMSTELENWTCGVNHTALVFNHQPSTDTVLKIILRFWSAGGNCAATTESIITFWENIVNISVCMCRTHQKYCSSHITTMRIPRILMKTAS